MAGSFESIDCRSYTRARRHPLVIGKIGGWTLPTPISPTQLLLLLGTFLALLWTRALWAHLGGVGNLLVQGFLPVLFAWMVRHLRVEGRPPLRALAGLVGFITAPRGGVLRGRSLRNRPTVRLQGGRFFIEEA